MTFSSVASAAMFGLSIAFAAVAADKASDHNHGSAAKWAAVAWGSLVIAVCFALDHFSELLGAMK